MIIFKTTYQDGNSKRTKRFNSYKDMNEFSRSFKLISCKLIKNR